MTGENDCGFGKTTAAQMLRKRAEAKVAADNKIFKEMSATEMSNLIYELRIHQVELEMQNEELRKSQAGTDRSRKAYQDHWELSPVGFISAFPFFFGKYNLPEVVAPGSKGAGTGQQIIAPHAVKTFIVNAL